MLKTITKILCYFNIFISVNSFQNCYTPLDVMNKGLVSYQNKVYDIENYIHPGDQDTLFLSAGKPLEDFFNMDRYNFHINSPLVMKDLENIYIGDLYIFCNITNNNDKNNILFNDSNIFYSVITFSLLIILLITNFTLNCSNSNCLNKNINLFYCYFISIDILLFCIIYILWWTSLLILSFFSNEILNRLGIWICFNIAFTLLPITRNSLWVVLLKISYNKLINIHKLIALLCLFSVIVKIITIIIL